MSDKLTLPRAMDRKLFFAKQVDQETIEALSKKIVEINDNDQEIKKLYDIYDLKYKAKPIEIYIDSYGGYIYQILGLVGIMNKSVTPVHTICTGAAMSCGFIMLVSGHKRFCYEHGTPLYHQVSTGFHGKVQDMVEEVQEAKRLQDKLEEITIRRTKISKKQLKENKKKKKDWFMTAEDALKLGVIDKII